MGRIKKLLSFLIFVAAVYYGWMLLPVYMASYQYQDSLAEIAKFSAMSTRTDDDIKQEVLKKAKEYDVPVTADQVKVSHDGTKIEISSDYTVVVDLLGGKKATLHFSRSSKEKAVGSTPAQPKKSN